MRTWIQVSKKNIKNNYNEFRKIIAPDCLLMAVVKSNAYGHNLIDFSYELEKLGIDFLGVDSLVEAETLRKKKIKKPILVLGHSLEEGIDFAKKNNISITISDIYQLNCLKKIKKSSPALKVHLKVDTGMHRQGIFINEIEKVLKIIKKDKNIFLEGVYTHFSCAKNPKMQEETKRQTNKFKKAIQILEKNGFHNTIKHASATSGTIISPKNHFDMTRIGIGLYGIWPSEEIKNLFSSKIKIKPALSWKTIVAQIKNVPKGKGIGYNLLEKTTRKTQIAILPIGYWHGFPRSLSLKGRVLIKNKEAKVLGIVSMDMLVVDITDIKNVKRGDDVIIIENREDSPVSAQKVALTSNTTTYELITRLNPKIKRIFY